MWNVVLIIGIVVAQLAVVALYAAYRLNRANRAARALADGRQRAVGVRTETAPTVGGSRSARRTSDGFAYRDGADVVARSFRAHLVLAAADIRDNTHRRDEVDERHDELVSMSPYVTADGTPVRLGVGEDWVPAFTQLARPVGASPASPRLRRSAVLAAAVTLPIAALLLLSGLAATTFQAVWWTGHAVSATVTGVDREEGTCFVEWAQDGAGHHAGVDCYEPYPAVGSSLSVRALAGPLTGQAMDTDGTFEAMTSLTLGALLLSGLAVAGRAVVVARRRPVRLLAARGRETAPARGTAPASAFASDRLVTAADRLSLEQADVPDLGRRVATMEGWVDDPRGTAPARSGWSDLRRVTPPTWPLYAAGAALAGAWLPERLDDRVRWILTAVGVAIVLYLAERTVATFSRVRRAGAGPFTSEWDFVTLRDVDDTWLVVLVLGGTPRWVVPFHTSFPGLSGTCLLRGDLTDGGAVQLQIDAEVWVPDGPAFRMRVEDAEDMRRDLVDVLVGRRPQADG